MGPAMKRRGADAIWTEGISWRYVGIKREGVGGGFEPVGAGNCRRPPALPCGLPAAGHVAPLHSRNKMSWTETSPCDHAEGRVDLGFLRFLQLLRMARWLACSTQAVEIEGVVAFFGARGLEMVLGVWIVLHDRKWEWDGDVGFMHGGVRVSGQGQRGLTRCASPFGQMVTSEEMR